MFRRRREQELNEEFQYHLDRLIEEGLDRGLAPEEARLAALRAMGAIEKSKDECRDLRRAHFVGDFVSDLRYAGRTLRRSPGFATLAVLIMALGIGANTAVFSVVNAVLLKRLPYPGAERIVALSSTVVRTGARNPLVTLANFRDWRDRTSSFEAMATYRAGEAPVSPGTTAEYGRHANVDGDFFRVFGVEAFVGRTFTAEESAPGSDQGAAVISDAYWKSRFGGDPSVIGQTIRVGVNPRPIVGVMPPGFQFPKLTDIWTNQTVRAASRTNHNMLAVGRLKPGVSLEQADAELAGIAAGLAEEYPDSNRGRGVALMGLQDQLVGEVRLTLYLLWGVVGLVLLIACANTATLLLGKATARTREVAVRAAIGANRHRIIRQLITESLLLAIIAGACGLLLAWWGAKALSALAPADVVRLANSGIDRGVLAFTLVVTLATSLLFGLVPALHASKLDLIDALKHDGARSVAGGRTIRARGVLVVSEIALAVVLLTGAGLLMKSLVALHRVDLGYKPENTLVVKATGVRSRQENTAFFREVIARIARLPGVMAVGAAMVPPSDLSNSGNGAYFIDRIPQVRDRTQDPFAYFNVVTPGIFAAAGIPIKSGRDFNDGDVVGQPLVAIVNEALVRQSLGGQNPIGHTIFCSFDMPDPMTIVGVVGDVRQRNPATEPGPECYMPYTQHGYNSWSLSLIVRTVGNPTALAGTIRQVAADVSPDVPISFKTMDAMVAEKKEDPRFRALMFGIFAGLAVCLAMAGVYGVTAFATEQRSKEIGLRIALGASTGTVLRLMLGQGLGLGAAGLALGLPAAVAATRLLTTMLFDVQPLDAPVYLGVAAVLSVVTLAAAYIPARRAAIVDPVEVLKAE